MSADAVRDARKQTVRIVTGSFLAGMGLMIVAGLVAPMIAQGGLSIREAVAATAQQREAPLVAPLDVQAIQAQLAEADRAMQSSRAQTDEAVAKLDQLSGR